MYMYSHHNSFHIYISVVYTSDISSAKTKPSTIEIVKNVTHLLLSSSVHRNGCRSSYSAFYHMICFVFNFALTYTQTMNLGWLCVSNCITQPCLPLRNLASTI